MKILLINKNHFVHGGADRVYLNTGQLLIDNGNQVAYFSTKNIDNIPTKFEDYFVSAISTRQTSNLNKIFTIQKYLYNIESKKKLKTLLKYFKPDIVHLHLFYGVISPSILSEIKKHNIPIVATIHDYRLICPANNMLDANNLVCEKCLPSNPSNCFLNKCSDKSLTQSAVLTLEAYIRKYFLKPIDYIDEFIFVSQFSKNKHLEADTRYRWKSTKLYNFANKIVNHVSPKGTYLLYFGRIAKEKGIITLINSIIGTKYNLKIVGSGPLEMDILKIIKSHINIEFLGFKSGEILEKLIQNSSFVVVPSEWFENNPMSIIESFALGKPVIGANIGGIPELVNIRNGYLFEQKNVKNLTEVINLANSISDKNYTELSNNCLEFSKLYLSKDNHYLNLNQIYIKQLNKKK
jgi:glycosyltransferase involved in cell wall biosynthesis